MLDEIRMMVAAADRLHWQKMLDCLQMPLLLLSILTIQTVSSISNNLQIIMLGLDRYHVGT